MSCPLRSATTRLSNSAGFSRRPRSRIARSSSAPFTRPTGAARFCACERLHDLRDADVRRLQLVRIDFDRQLALDLAEDLHVGHAGNRAQLARDARIGEPRELGRRQHRRRDRDRDDRPIGVVELLNDRLLHLRRQIRADRRDRVAHFLRRDVHVLVEQELDHDHRVAVVRLAHDALHAGDRADLLLDRLEHFALDDVGRRAGIDDAHRQERRRRRRGTRPSSA